MEMKLYIPETPWEIKLTIAFPGLALGASSALFVFWVENYLAAALAFSVSLLCGYWYYGLQRSVRLMKSKYAFHIYKREVLEPLATPSETEIDFDNLVEVSYERGPRSHHGPEVQGERIAVLKTKVDEIRVSSRWFSEAAFIEFWNDAKEVVANNSTANK